MQHDQYGHEARRREATREERAKDAETVGKYDGEEKQRNKTKRERADANPEQMLPLSRGEK